MLLQQLLIEDEGEGEDEVLMNVLKEVGKEIDVTPRVIKSRIAQLCPEPYVKGYADKFAELWTDGACQYQVACDLRCLKTVTPLHLRISLRR